MKHSGETSSDGDEFGAFASASPQSGRSPTAPAPIANAAKTGNASASMADAAAELKGPLRVFSELQTEIEQVQSELDNCLQRCARDRSGFPAMRDDECAEFLYRHEKELVTLGEALMKVMLKLDHMVFEESQISERQSKRALIVQIQERWAAIDVALDETHAIESGYGLQPKIPGHFQR